LVVASCLTKLASSGIGDRWNVWWLRAFPGLRAEPVGTVWHCDTRAAECIVDAGRQRAR